MNRKRAVINDPMKQYPHGETVAFGIRLDTQTVDIVDRLASMAHHKRAWVVMQLVNIAIPIVEARIERDETWYREPKP